MAWFTRCLGVKKEYFHPRIFINASHRDRERVLVRYWSKTLGLPKDVFAKTIFITRPNKKVYENRNTYYGVLALRVRKGTDLRYKILALLDRVAEQ